MKTKIKEFDLLDARISIFNYRNLKRIDWILTGIVLVLAFIGFAVLYSASRSMSSDGAPIYIRQLCYFVFGAFLALTILCIDSRFLVSIAPVFYIFFMGLLLAVILFGKTAKGGQRWLPLGIIHLQPSEQTKLVVVYMLTWYLTTIKERIRQFPYLILGFILTGVPAILILKQPSLGTALALVPVSIVMMYVAGCKWWHLGLLILAGILVAPIAYKHLQPYQRQRLMSFVNPEADPKGTGWQTRQSKITIGSGGLSGKGFMKGTQTAFNYLPEHHTDFIFSLLGEEEGFIGGAVVIGLFAALIWRGLRLAADCSDMAGTLLACGAVTILAFHIFVNIAITVGLMPVTGIPLPFLSFGGNYYITTMMCIGVLLNVPVRKQLFE